MLTVSASHLPLLVSAIQDAIRYNEELLRSETVHDVSDHEEHLLCLENLAAWLEGEYRRLQKEHPDLIVYDDLAKRLVRGS